MKEAFLMRVFVAAVCFVMGSFVSAVLAAKPKATISNEGQGCLAVMNAKSGMA